MFDYNFVGDGIFDPLVSPHMVSGAPSVAGVHLLNVDLNADGTPDILDPLNQRSASGSGTHTTLSYAWQQMALVFGLTASSPAIDAGIGLGLGIPDPFGNNAYDDPAIPNPWPGIGGTGLHDMGAIERVP